MPQTRLCHPHPSARSRKNLVARADGLPESVYRELERRAEGAFATEAKRQTQPRVKEELVRANNYRNIRLRSEDVAEFTYAPIACKREYRIVVLRKNLTIEKGMTALFDETRYFFWLLATSRGWQRGEHWVV